MFKHDAISEAYTMQVAEGLSERLLHGTTISHAISIFNDNELKPSLVDDGFPGNKSELDGRDSKYFISFARSFASSYFSNKFYPISVIFEFNGTIISQRFRGSPFSYNSQNINNRGANKSETEERIWLKDSRPLSINKELGGIKTIYIIIDGLVKEQSFVYERVLHSFIESILLEHKVVFMKRPGIIATLDDFRKATGLIINGT